MSALGQKRTSECVRTMSALPPKADVQNERLSVGSTVFRRLNRQDDLEEGATFAVR